VTRPVTALPANCAPRPRKRPAEPLAGLADRRKREESGAATFDEVDAYSIDEFCRRHRISVQVFYKYPRLMPATFYVGARRLISREAATRWRAEREAATFESA
jgi:hypothetical protein